MSFLYLVYAVLSWQLMEDSLDDSIMNGDAVSDKMEPDNQESSSKADGPAVSSD